MVFGRWHLRFIALRADRLRYWRSVEDATSGKVPLGEILFNSASTLTRGDNRLEFTLVAEKGGGKASFSFRAATVEDCDDWLRLIKEHIRNN